MQINNECYITLSLSLSLSLSHPDVPDAGPHPGAASHLAAQTLEIEHGEGSALYVREVAPPAGVVPG